VLLRRKVAAVARILTAAEAAAIEAAVDPAVAAQADTDLAAIPAFHMSKAALIWYELVKKHVFPKEGSIIDLALQRQFLTLVETQDSSLVPGCYLETARKIKTRATQAYLDNNSLLLRQLSEAAALVTEGKVSQPLDIAAVALLVFRELFLELGTRPTPCQVRTRVERRKGRISDYHWRQRTFKVIRPLFD
jgi:hypothetical protein